MVRNNSSTSPLASSEPNVVGPASARTSECPRARSTSSAAREIHPVAVVHRDDIRQRARQLRRSRGRQHDRLGEDRVSEVE